MSVKDIRWGYVVEDRKNDLFLDVGSAISQVIILNHPSSIAAGYSPVLDCCTAQITCKLADVTEKIGTQARSQKTVPKLQNLGIQPSFR